MTESTWGTGSLDSGGGLQPSGSWRPIKVLVGIVAVLVLLGGGAAYYFFVYRAPHAAAVIIAGNVPSQIFGGQPFDMGITVVNAAVVSINNATLTILLPDGIDATDRAPGTRTISVQLGELAAHGTASTTLNLVAHGDPNIVRQVQTTLEYATAESGTKTFRQEQAIAVSLGSPAVGLTIDGPQYVAVGNSFAITVHYTNNLASTMPPSSIRIAYPPTFTFASAQPAPNEGNNQWNLPELPPGQDGTIVVHGTVAPAQSPSFPFTATVIGGTSARPYEVTEQSLTPQLLAQPLLVTLIADGKQDGTADIGSTISYDVVVKNASSFPLSNLTVFARLQSPLFIGSSVSSDGTFSSLDNSITWNVASTPSLRTLAPGEEARVRFSIGTVKNFPIHTAGDKNFTLVVAAGASSPTVPAGTAVDRVSGAGTSTIKLSGLLSMDAQGYWKDAKSGITNTGPYPPQVNKPTQYTIHWIINTQATDMKNVHLSASLQSGAKWMGKTKTNQSTGPVYNRQTGEVTWDIPLLAANRGIAGSPAAEAIFQVEQTPSTNQVGREVPLISDTQLTAIDAFTGESVSAHDIPITTGLPDDTVAPRSGAVIQS